MFLKINKGRNACYGKRGDEVVVVASHTDVMIVEKDGVRFSCRVDEMQEEPVPEEIIIEVKPFDLFNQIWKKPQPYYKKL